MDTEQFKKQLEKLGRQKVHENLLQGKYNPLNRPIVEAWLHEQEKREAKESNRIARSAKKISIWALIISGISLLVTIIFRMLSK